MKPISEQLSGCALLLLLTAGAGFVPGSLASGDLTALAYQVDCPAGAQDAGQCEVDKATYVGWRTFQASCFACHGAGGVGTTFGPNLLDRLNDRVDYARFKEVIEGGYRGQMGVMPAWKNNPQVMPRLDDLFTYLRARADGVLPNGRPKRKKD